MPMSPRKKAQTAFIAAGILLLLSGFATYLSITRLQQSTHLVIHTHQVKSALGDIDAAVLRAGRARLGYRTIGSEEYRQQFDMAVRDIPVALQHLCDLTRDNTTQRDLCARLTQITNRRMDLLRQSM